MFAWRGRGSGAGVWNSRPSPFQGGTSVVRHGQDGGDGPLLRPGERLPPAAWRVRLPEGLQGMLGDLKPMRAAGRLQTSHRTRCRFNSICGTSACIKFWKAPTKSCASSSAAACCSDCAPRLNLIPLIPNARGGLTGWHPLPAHSCPAHRGTAARRLGGRCRDRQSPRSRGRRWR